MPNSPDDGVCHTGILSKLALGVDPDSGAPLSSDHVLNRPEVIRALMLAVNALKSVEGRKNGAAAASRAGVSWDATEEQELREMFENGKSLSSIALSLQRSKGSIRARLVKVGLLDEFQAVSEK